MFKHIQFESLEFKSPITSNDRYQNYDKFKVIYQNIDNHSAYFHEDTQSVDYIIQGESEVIFPLPISQFAEESLLYLQIFSFVKAGASFYTKRKDYASYLLLYTYQGNGKLEYSGQVYELSEGYGFLIDCRKPHYYYTTGSSWQHSILHFNGNTAEWLFQKFCETDNILFFNPLNSTFQKNLEEVLMTYQEINSYREFEVSLLINKLLLDIIKAKKAKEQTIPDYVRYLQKYMESNFTNPLSLDELSSFAGVSKYHLDREFKKYTGFSLTSYLIELRLGRVKFLLVNSNLPTVQISLTCGFSSYPSFLKIFKNRTNMTPTEYRKRNQ